uniref:Uncharacterized protein n=1 Tax=Rhizophora mucronata TaxID=61149 RepID=A0A2P2QKZ3_RHIMU
MLFGIWIFGFAFASMICIFMFLSASDFRGI